MAGLRSVPYLKGARRFDRQQMSRFPIGKLKRPTVEIAESVSVQEIFYSGLFIVIEIDGVHSVGLEIRSRTLPFLPFHINLHNQGITINFDAIQAPTLADAAFAPNGINRSIFD